MFCILEQDDKTFCYLKRYLDAGNNTYKVFQLDNIIQREEIEVHLNINNKNNLDAGEMLEWVKRYSPQFREYINTIKLLAMLFMIEGKNSSNITYEEYIEKEKSLNKVDKLFFTIHP